jgi:hypothetical protein
MPYNERKTPLRYVRTLGGLSGAFKAILRGVALGVSFLVAWAVRVSDWQFILQACTIANRKSGFPPKEEHRSRPITALTHLTPTSFLAG